MELADPRSIPNRVRVAVEQADPGLKVLERVLTAPRKRGHEDFEAGVPLLLSMLGFNTAYVGALSNMGDAADAYAFAPAGDVLVVECTTGVPDWQKFRKLIDRVVEARRVLCTSATQLTPDRVTPIMATPVSFDEIAADALQTARAHAVVLLCRSEIEASLRRTRSGPTPDVTLAEWRRMPFMRLVTQGVS